MPENSIRGVVFGFHETLSDSLSIFPADAFTRGACQEYFSFSNGLGHFWTGGKPFSPEDHPFDHIMGRELNQVP
jgi:hypothetical protein